MERKNASKNIDNYIFIILETSRDTLYKNINQRFEKMVEKGLVKEVKSFINKKISSDHPINKMIGLKHIKRFILGEINLDEAISLSQRDSRRYAKRQITWFKHQPQNAIHFSYSDAYNYLKKFILFFRCLIKYLVYFNYMIKKYTGAELVIESLISENVKIIFGYPGGAVLPIYDELFKQNKIRHILVRHEQAAVHAAEGYARSTGKVGVVLVTSGPGATNTVTGLQMQ